MPPLEDELRATLHGRAATLPPPADPLAGIEQRARGLRRRRTAASVAGTALVVLAVVGVVPLVTSPGGSTPGVVATAAPTQEQAPSPYALDLDDPWEYRGDRAVLGDGNLETWQREWAVRHPGAEVVPLFGQVWEPSGQPELVFASRLPGTDRIALGVAQTSESGPRFLVVERDGREPLLTVPVVVAGDEVPRLLLVAAPDVAQLQYAADGERFEDMATLVPGVATAGVEQPPGRSDAYRVVGERGELVEQGPVADEPASDPAEPVVAEAPANVLEWEPRGRVDGQVVLAARAAYAAGRQAGVEDVQEKVLFAGDDDAGRRYLLGQFWLVGDETADTFGVVRSADGEVEPQLYRPATEETAVLALYLSPPNEQSRGELVVVPQPGTGQVLYAGDEASEWVPKDTPGLDGVVLFERNPEAERTEGPDDLVRLLDGDGRETATVTVRSLLCGTTSCS